MLDFRKIKPYCILFLCCLLVFTVLASALMLSGQAQEPGTALPVLMYHHILKDTKKLNTYTVSLKEFEQDLAYIHDNGYTTVTVSDLLAFVQSGVPLPDKPIMITFDDGYESVYAYAYPLLKQYGMKAAVGVVGRYTDVCSELEDHTLAYSNLTWKELKEMSDSGIIEVQNHSYNLHAYAPRKGAKKMKTETVSAYAKLLKEDLSTMQARCQEQIGRAPDAFFYPFGAISKEALPIIKEVGFKAAFTCWEKVNFLTGNPEELYHINRFNRAHGISTAAFFQKIEKQL